MCPIYNRNGVSIIPLKGRKFKIGCTESGNNGKGIIIPENIQTIAGNTWDTPSPEIVHISEILTIIEIDDERKIANIIAIINPNAESIDVGGCKPKNNRERTKIGIDLSVVGAVRLANSRLNHSQYRFNGRMSS
jgi:hypothetical protein